MRWRTRHGAGSAQDELGVLMKRRQGVTRQIHAEILQSRTGLDPTDVFTYPSRARERADPRSVARTRRDARQNQSCIRAGLSRLSFEHWGNDGSIGRWYRS